MFKVIFLLIVSFSSVYAQLNLMQVSTLQSSEELNWKIIENDAVIIYYPDFLSYQAQYIANLVQYFQADVTREYKVDKPKKFPLILRAEVSSPNGFVTLAPRRSEWFTSANINPIVGGLEWYQALAIHEYRHIIQFDYMNRHYNKGFRYLLGDFGQAIALFLTADPWFFEGDAVWTETYYTDAGRGRSPRFSARLRALIDAGYEIDYDRLLLGDFEIPQPNHYVYGYYLTTYAYNKFGKDIWRRIIDDSADTFPYPYRFYRAFEVMTGQNFDDFSKETFSHLRDEWKESEKKKLSLKELKDYRNYAWPMVDGTFTYVLKRDLDSFWAIYNVSTPIEKKISNLYIEPNFSKPDIKRGYLVYTQELPDRRYSLKSYNDIFVMSLYSKENERITYEKRYYHPKLHPKENLIYALRFRDNNSWCVEVIDFTGKIHNRLELKDMFISEFVFRDSDDIIALVQRQDGLKAIFQIRFIDGELKQLSPFTRNNLFGLHFDNGYVYFEADYQGKVEIFSLNILNQFVTKCTTSQYASFEPWIENKQVHYVSVDAKGRTYKKEPINCEMIDKEEVFNIDYYVGSTPSDSFTQSTPKQIENIQVLKEKNLKEKDYKKMDDSLNLHSWNFFGGRGFQLQGFSNNYLNDIAITGTLGSDAEEERGFGKLEMSYAKFYPIFGASLYYGERNINYSSGSNDQFSEANIDFSMTLPYFWRENLFQGSLSLQFNLGQSHISNRKRNSRYEQSDDQVLKSSVKLSYDNLKDMRFRELLPSAGMRYIGIVGKADSYEDHQFSNFLNYHKLTYFHKGFAPNHGFKLSLEDERQRESNQSYRFNSPSATVNQYAFSRGYNYEYTSHFFKGSLNYTSPLSYPNWKLKDYLYINRIYTNLFYDYTNIDTNNLYRTINSFGAEMTFESLTFRKLPLNYGLRLLHREKDNQNVAEVFLGVGIEM